MTLAILLVTAGRARAAEDVIALDYSAPAICPSAAEFEAQIRGFIPTLSVVARDASPRSFEVSISDSGNWGRLSLLTEQGGGSREVHGDSCGEVARFLAFAVAIVLDPEAQMPEPPPPVASEAHRAPLDAGVLPRPLPASLVSTEHPTEPERRPQARRLVSIDQSIATFGSLTTPASPSPSYGIGVIYGITTPVLSLRPQLRFAASYAVSSPASREGATVDFVEVLGAVEGCPRRFPVGPVELWPCVRVDAGARRTSADGIASAKTRVRPWVSLDALIYARFHVAAPLFLELGGGVMLPAFRDRVFFEPDLTVHQVPRAGFLGQVAVGVEFGDRNQN